MMSCCIAGGDGDMGEPDAFYAIRPECRDDVLKTHFKPKRGKTLSARRWHDAFSQEGYLDITKVLGRIQRGGVHPTIKGVVWEFLLGCFDPKSTFDQRTQLRQQRREEYGRLKSKCQEMEKKVGTGRIITTPVITDDGQPIVDGEVVASQETVVTLDKEEVEWKLTLHQIGLDVVRTDRSLVFYENEQNQATLWNVLAVYSWIDKDIGYCQGMSDLCSPIIILVENEADAFWCFERLMRRLRGNFKSTATSIGVRAQLDILASIIEAVDPKLHQHLVSLDAEQYMFAFRMLMVLFRREVSFVDTLYLWELMWAMEYNPNLFSMYESNATTDGTKEPVGNANLLKQYGKFVRTNMKTGLKGQQIPLSVFLAGSVLESRNKRLLTEAKGLDDVAQILNDTSEILDAKKVCNEALKLQKTYLKKAKVS